MALPQRKEEGFRQQPGEILQMGRKAGGSPRDIWFYIAIASAIVLLAVCVTWIWGTRRNARPPVEKRTTPVTVPLNNDVAVLDAAEKQPYAGQPFHAYSIPVRYEVNERVLWVGENNSPPLLVVLTGSGNAARANISNRDLVNIQGTVEIAPSPDQAKQNWSLGLDDAHLLEREGAYIRATQVTPITHQQGTPQ